jgi:hypothetical protein
MWSSQKNFFRKILRSVSEIQKPKYFFHKIKGKKKKKKPTGVSTAGPPDGSSGDHEDARRIWQPCNDHRHHFFFFNVF